MKNSYSQQSKTSSAQHLPYTICALLHRQLHLGEFLSRRTLVGDLGCEFSYNVEQFVRPSFEAHVLFDLSNKNTRINKTALICVCKCTHTRTCTCARTRTALVSYSLCSVHARLHTYMHTHIHIHTYTHTQT